MSPRGDDGPSLLVLPDESPDCQAKAKTLTFGPLGKLALFDGQQQSNDSPRKCHRALAGEHALKEGKLQFQDRSRAIMRCCILFSDRLDAWDNHYDMVQRLTPQCRIMLAEVYSMEIVNSGFILIARSRKHGIHVGTNEELREWCGLLVRLIAPAQGAQRQEDASPASSASTSGLHSPGGWPKEVMTKPPSWVPRVATLSGPSHRQPAQRFPAYCRKSPSGQPPAEEAGATADAE